MFLKHLEKVRIHKGLPTQDRDEINPQFLGLSQNPLDQIVFESWMTLITQRITSSAPQVAPPGRTQDHDKRRSEAIVLLEEIPLLSAFKPRIVEERVEDLDPVLFWQMIEHLVKKLLG